MLKRIRYALVGFVIGTLWISITASQARGDGHVVAISPGAWQISEISGFSRRTICVADSETLLQPPVSSSHCVRFAINEGSDAVVVEYRCAGRGWWRNELKIHDATSIVLGTQGIADGEPFNATYRGRLVGACVRKN